MYFVVKYGLTFLEHRLDPEAEKKAEARKKSAAMLRRIGYGRDAETSESEEEEGPRRPRKEDLILNTYEQAIAMDLVAPEDIPITFNGTHNSDNGPWTS